MKLNKKQLGLTVAIASAFSALSGCATAISEKVDTKATQDTNRVVSTYEKTFEKVPPLKRNFKQSNDIWINPTPLPSYVVDKKPVPSFFQNKVSITMPQALPVNEVVSELSRSYFDKYQKQLNIDVAQDVFNPNGGIGQVLSSKAGAAAAPAGAAATQTINGLGANQINNVLIDSFIYDGSLETALNLLTQKAGLSWEWNGSSVEIYRFKVKNYYISALSGSLNSTSTISSSSSTTAEAKTESGSAGTSGTSTGQTLTSTSSIDQISEITTYIRSMLSPTGRLSIMESTGIVTVRDTPLVHDSIEKSIRELNAVLSKQIHVNLEVYAVEVNEVDNVGIDWNLVWSGARGTFGYKSLTNTTGLNSTNIGIATGPFNGSSILLGLNASIGKVVNGTAGSIVTQNGKITPIILANAREYIRSITSSSNSSGNNAVPTFTATPATATTGLDAKVQARIQPDGKILLKINMNMSELKDLREFQVGSGAGASSVQLADTDLRNIEQEITLKSGQTLVLSGFKQLRTKKENAGTGNPYNMILGGGKRTAEGKNVHLVVIATPYLIENND